jgi:hypothetical protein
LATVMSAAWEVVASVAVVRVRVREAVDLGKEAAAWAKEVLVTAMVEVARETVDMGVEHGERVVAPKVPADTEVPSGMVTSEVTQEVASMATEAHQVEGSVTKADVMAGLQRRTRCSRRCPIRTRVRLSSPRPILVPSRSSSDSKARARLHTLSASLFGLLARRSTRILRGPSTNRKRGGLPIGDLAE